MIDPKLRKVQLRYCELCGTIVPQTPYEFRLRVNQHVFCCREHYYEYMGRNQVECTCEFCYRPILRSQRYAEKVNHKFCDVECFRLWASQNQVGPGNTNWRGGAVSNYGPDWDLQRQRARERDDFTCQLCGQAPPLIDVHHITPFREFGLERSSEANRLENLVCLCRNCHPRVERNPDLLKR